MKQVVQRIASVIAQTISDIVGRTLTITNLKDHKGGGKVLVGMVVAGFLGLTPIYGKTTMVHFGLNCNYTQQFLM